MHYGGCKIYVNPLCLDKRELPSNPRLRSRMRVPRSNSDLILVALLLTILHMSAIIADSHLRNSLCVIQR
jgi:hypothetical protein